MCPVYSGWQEGPPRGSDVCAEAVPSQTRLLYMPAVWGQMCIWRVWEEQVLFLCSMYQRIPAPAPWITGFWRCWGDKKQSIARQWGPDFLRPSLESHCARCMLKVFFLHGAPGTEC